MKSTVVLASLYASCALATPFRRGRIHTAWVYTTVTETVTGVIATPTPAVGNDGRFYGASSSSSSSQAPAPVVPAPVPTTVLTQVSVPAVETPTQTPTVVVPTVVETPAVQTPTIQTPPSIPSSSAPVALPSPPASSAPNDYAKLILDQHNNHRANHSAPALTWSAELTSWAEQIGKTCVYEHSRAAGDGQYGQNIGAGTAPSDVGKMITNGMYNGEMTHYDWYGQEPDMSNFGDWGHFSQIVWADTTEVGCATVDCGHNLANVGSGIAGYFTVCNYRPAGNFGGRYAKNVLRPKGANTVVV